MRIAICVYLPDRTGTTRAIEIAKSIRSIVTNSRIYDVEICFFGNKAPQQVSYEHLIMSEGFKIIYFKPDIDINMWLAFVEAEQTGQGFYPPPYNTRAVAHIRGIIDGLNKFQPTIIVQSFFPEVSIVAKLLQIHSIAFGHIPPDVEWMEKNLFRLNEKAIDDKMLISKQQKSPMSTLYEAAFICGWKTDIHGSEFHMIPRADVCLVCDLESNYPDRFRFGKHMYVVGPIFARTNTGEASSSEEQTAISTINRIKGAFGIHNKVVSVDKLPLVLPYAARKVLEDKQKKKVLLFMGSNVEQNMLVEAIKALSGPQYNIVIVLPPTRSCTRENLTEVFKSVKVYGAFFVVNDFIALDNILPYIDIMVTHGGQDSLQCCLAHGIPVVGLPMQKEQRWNLDNIERRNAGIQLCRGNWSAENIRVAVEKVLNSTRYTKAACQVREEINKINGSRNAAEIILSFAVAQEQIKGKVGFYNRND